MYVTGTGSEEYWMNRLADAMVPYLNSCGIRYKRNTPDMTAGSSIRQANAGWYDFYLALHSNASGEGNYGGTRGIIAFYYPSSSQGQRAAQIFVNNLRTIYPPARQGHHPGHHQPGGGPGLQVPGQPPGDRLPRQLRGRPLD